MCKFAGPGWKFMQFTVQQGTCGNVCVFFRHLQQSGTLDVMGDLTQDILDLADRDITDKVQKLIWKFCLMVHLMWIRLLVLSSNGKKSFKILILSCYSIIKTLFIYLYIQNRLFQSSFTTINRKITESMMMLQIWDRFNNRSRIWI